MNIFTQRDWVPSWRELEHSSTNVGIDHVINPTLYPLIIKSLTSTNALTTILDFGSGTSSLAFDLCIKQPKNVPGLQAMDSVMIQNARKNIGQYIGFESEQRLVEDANKRFQKFGITRQFESIHMQLPLERPIPSFEKPTLAVSRNFLMHQTIEEFDEHIKQVAEIVQTSGLYIFATLNPEYEKNKEQKNFQDGESYAFHHGRAGELGVFSHYFKSDVLYKKILEQYFVIETQAPCFPVTEKFSQSHPRYYNPLIPMAYVYVVRAK